jgi:hypothetical protein
VRHARAYVRQVDLEERYIARKKPFPTQHECYRMWAVGRSPFRSHTSSKHAALREQCKWVRPCLRSGTSMKYAILIDAGFVKRKLGSQAAPLDAAEDSSRGIADVLMHVLRAHELPYRRFSRNVYRKSTW